MRALSRCTETKSKGQYILTVLFTHIFLTQLLVLSQSSYCFWGRKGFNARLNGLYIHNGTFDGKPYYVKTGCWTFFIFWKSLHSRWNLHDSMSVDPDSNHAKCTSTSLSNCISWRIYNGSGYENDPSVSFLSVECPYWPCDQVQITSLSEECNQLFDMNTEHNVWTNEASTRYWYFNPEYFQWHCDTTYDLCSKQWDAYTYQGWTETQNGQSTSLNFESPETIAAADCIVNPTNVPTYVPSVAPTTSIPTIAPTNYPSGSPTNLATLYPSNVPSDLPSQYPSNIPSQYPSNIPSQYPSNIPSQYPSNAPTQSSIIPNLVSIDTTDYLPTAAEGTTPQTFISETIDSVEMSETTDNMLVILFVTLSSCFCFCIVAFAIKYRRSNGGVFKVNSVSPNEAQPPIDVKPNVAQSDIVVADDEEINDVDDEDDEDKREVKAWLKDVVKLPQYYTSFVDHGYETISFVKAITYKFQLRDIGIDVLGHQTRILSQIRRLRNEHNPPGVKGVISNEKRKTTKYSEGESTLEGKVVATGETHQFDDSPGVDTQFYIA